MSENVFEGLPEVDPESSPAVEAKGREPSWMRRVEEKGWELLAEVPGGSLRLDLRPGSATVMLLRPAGKPRQSAEAAFFGPDRRKRAIRWAKSEARAMARKVPKRRKANGPI